jgi:predicted permease
VSAELKRDVVVLACAISAGIHAALTPEHFEDGIPAGLGFAVAAVALGGLTIVLAHDPAERLALTAAAAVLAGLLLSYGFAVTTGVPVLHPEQETVDALALVTKAIEAVGLVAAVSLLRRPHDETDAPRSLPVAVAAVVAVFSAFVALELSGDHGHHDHGHAPGDAAKTEHAT